MKTMTHAAPPVDLDRLVRLNEEFRNACRALCDATKQELPVGTIIEATLGRSRVRGEVISHAGGWSTYHAGSVNVRNLKSGKIRRVTPHYYGHEVTVISLPNVSNGGTAAPCVESKQLPNGGCSPMTCSADSF